MNPYSIVKGSNRCELFLTTCVPDVQSEDTSILEGNHLLEVACTDSGLGIVIEFALFEAQGYGCLAHARVSNKHDLSIQLGVFFGYLVLN